MTRGLEEVASGAWAGFVGTVLGYPLDVVKSRMQTGKTGVPMTTGGVGVTAATQASFGEVRGDTTNIHKHF